MTKLEGITAAFNALMNNRNVNYNKRVSNNTTVTVNNGVLTVCLHNTNVFVYDFHNSEMTFKTGGFFTATTRNTINTALAACSLKSVISFAKGRFMINGYDFTEMYDRNNSLCFVAK